MPILPKTRFDEYSLQSERDTVSIALGAYANPDGTEILYARISHSVFESLNERFLIPESAEFKTPQIQNIRHREDRRIQQWLK